MKYYNKKNKTFSCYNNKFKIIGGSKQKKSSNHDERQQLATDTLITKKGIDSSSLFAKVPTAHNINFLGKAKALTVNQKFPDNEKGGIIHIKSFDELSPLEIYNILKIRQDTFLIEQKITYEDIDGKDMGCLHVWYENQKTSEFGAYLRIVPLQEEKKISIGRVLTIQAMRGKGIARDLMRKGVQFVHSHYPEYLLTLSAKNEMCPFYEALGFKKTGKPFFFPKEDSTPIFPMVYAGHKSKNHNVGRISKRKKWA